MKGKVKAERGEGGAGPGGVSGFWILHQVL